MGSKNMSPYFFLSTNRDNDFINLKEGEKLYSIWRKNYVDIAGRVATLEPAKQRCTSYNNVFIKYIRKLRTMQG